MVTYLIAIYVSSIISNIRVNREVFLAELSSFKTKNLFICSFKFIKVLFEKCV